MRTLDRPVACIAATARDRKGLLSPRMVETWLEMVSLIVVAVSEEP